MKAVLLSGGKGKRLWPVSTDHVPKQFLKIFNDSTNMLERTINKVNKVLNREDIYIATCEEYKKEIKKYTTKSNIIIEPAMIGTFGAILNLSVYLKYKANSSDDEIVAVVPIDHDVDENFYNILENAKNHLIKTNTDICLIGINPTFPSEEYGYIITDEGFVKRFKEKPTTEEAIELIANNALWNSGLLVFRLGKIIKIAKEHISFNNYKEFNEKYLTLPHISFDYEVLEKEDRLAIVKSTSSWNDIGTWDILADKIKEPDEYNTNIINFESKEIRNKGVNNSIVVNSSYGLLLKPKKNINKEYRQWGHYEVITNIDEQTKHLKIKKLTIYPNRNISYQYHKIRHEDWYIMSGTGEVIIDGIKKNVKPGDIINVPREAKHSIKATTTLNIVEVQHGDEKIEEEDIVRLEFDWNKIRISN